MSTLKEIQAIEEAWQKQKDDRVRRQDRLAEIEFKREQASKAKERELDEIEAYNFQRHSAFKQRSDLLEEAAKRLARKDRIEGMRIHNALRKKKEAQALANELQESRRKSSSLEASRYREDLEARHARQIQTPIEALRLLKANKARAEQLWRANELEQSRRASEVANAVKAAEWAERKRLEKVARQERQAAAREKKRLKQKAEEAFRREESLRSYGGLMAMPGTSAWQGRQKRRSMHGPTPGAIIDVR